jgi:hypothetical protein
MATIVNFPVKTSEEIKAEETAATAVTKGVLLALTLTVIFWFLTKGKV